MSSFRHLGACADLFLPAHSKTRRHLAGFLVIIVALRAVTRGLYMGEGRVDAPHVGDDFLR